MAYSRGSSSNIIVGAAALFTHDAGPIGYDSVTNKITDAQAATDDATMNKKLKEGVKLIQDEALALGGSALTYYYPVSPKIKGIEDYRLIEGAKIQTVSNWGFMWTTAYLTK